MSVAAEMVEQRTVLGPQVGPQTMFLQSDADIAIYGGSAFGGKTWALLAQPLLHINDPGFGATILRRTYKEIKDEGAMWDASCKIYPLLGAIPKESSYRWIFPSGAVVRFAHVEHEKHRFDFKGAEIPLICFDQLETFTRKQFFYIRSRNRTTVCDVRSYTRATCNPDADSWLRDFIAWWIDEKTGYPIKSRSGVKRWYVMDGDEIVWHDAPDGLDDPISVTFIPASPYDNKIGMAKDPEYLKILKNMPLVEKERLLLGNWNVRDAAGMYFRREWFEIVDAAPAGGDTIRYWDRAASVGEDGSATAGGRMKKADNGIFYVEDMARFRVAPPEVRQRIKAVATQDTAAVRVGIEQDPGQAGKAEALDQVRNLAGFTAHVNVVRESKGARSKPYSAQVLAGNVKLVRGAWNDEFLREHENFDGTSTCASDQVDACSGAFHMLTSFKRAGTWGKQYAKKRIRSMR